MIMPKVFLGGTVNGSEWRNYVMPRLSMDYFNPVVEEWNEEAYQEELYERENSDFLLYVITPKMTGVYSIAEVIDDSNKRPEKTVFCVLYEDGLEEFTQAQRKSLVAVGKMVVDNGGTWCEDLEDTISFLNTREEAMLQKQKVEEVETEVGELANDERMILPSEAVFFDEIEERMVNQYSDFSVDYPDVTDSIA